LDNRSLTREEVRSVIEGRGAAERVPMMVHFWTHPGAFGERQGLVEELLARYPMDVSIIGFDIPQVFDAPQDDPEYRWVNFDDPFKDKNVGIDEKIAIQDWEQLDGVLKEFPSPEYPGLFKAGPVEDGRYRLGSWWFCLFERHWSLRGMTNALIDFYEEPEKVHRLYRALTDFYMRMMERGKKEQNLDGVFVSDDLGTQTGPFFSPSIFKEFFKPYYKELIEKAHSLGMHFWLHTCGNIEMFLPDFIEIGLDVIHPIQKYTMDEKKIAEKFGKDICIWAGFDVQRIIPYGTPEEVRAEVRFMIDTYYRKEGKLILTAGNGITPDCKLESLEALLDEAYNYGRKSF
jgi:uroporphyrinogen decarboxylase